MVLINLWNKDVGSGLLIPNCDLIQQKRLFTAAVFPCLENIVNGCV